MLSLVPCSITTRKKGNLHCFFSAVKRMTSFDIQISLASELRLIWSEPTHYLSFLKGACVAYYHGIRYREIQDGAFHVYKRRNKEYVVGTVLL